MPKVRYTQEVHIGLQAGSGDWSRVLGLWQLIGKGTAAVPETNEEPLQRMPEDAQLVQLPLDLHSQISRTRRHRCQVQRQHPLEKARQQAD